MATEPLQRGIFCMETVWYDSKDQTSIRPILEMLRDSFLEVPFIYRIAVTRDAFKKHLKEWLNTNAREFPILYLGYHGKRNCLYLDEDYSINSKVDLQSVAEWLGKGCNNRLVHFASCSTLDITPDQLKGLVKNIGASAISGYKKEIKWMESAAFELNYLQRLQFDHNRGLTKAVMKKVDEGTDEFPSLCRGNPLAEFGKKLLGFKLQVQP